MKTSRELLAQARRQAEEDPRSASDYAVLSVLEALVNEVAILRAQLSHVGYVVEGGGPS